jgi:ubiquitin carboxyl-terminal hydrolase 4/11/15
MTSMILTKKPYIEKPEQGEDEADDVAANKAWSLHLQREDSRVLENFMGQVKSRLECCEPGCNRVSTTFDPFMYLSVPIPGSTDRNIEITFVPLDPTQKMRKLVVTVSKTGSVADVLSKMNQELVRLGVCKEYIPSEDLCSVDVWSHEIYRYYQPTDDVHCINRDSDKPFVYQLRSLEEIKKTCKDNESPDDSFNGWEAHTRHKVKLDLATRTRLNANDAWMDEINIYTRSRNTAMYHLFNPRHSTNESRMQFHKKLENFLDDCYTELEKEESSGLKRTREQSEIDEHEDVEMDHSAAAESEEVIQGLVDRSEASDSFQNVRTKQDVAILEFCANKLRQHILRLLRDAKSKSVTIQVLIRQLSGSGYSSRDGLFTLPMVLRIPGNCTVYDLRKVLSVRLSRSLGENNYPNSPMQDTNAGEPSAEAPSDKQSTAKEEQGENPPELDIMLRAPLSYGKKSSGYGGPKVNLLSQNPLGMIESDIFDTDSDIPKIAVPTDEREQMFVGDVVGDQGTVCINWEEEYIDKVFNIREYESTEGPTSDTTKTSNGSSKETTVLDCIKKYCQKEQLEETEMWYCNKCKNHVRAWKQFHLYRTPPILIIHLKRFYFSPTSHRRDKITTKIDFPLKGLDLTDLVADFGEDNEPIYDCYAVSNHFGGLGGGHYTAFILSDDDGTWSNYDDSRVSRVNDPKEVVSEAAYVLYYRRRDVPVGHDSDYNYGNDQSFPPSPMVCEQSESQVDQNSELSSNNTAQAGDMDVILDDMASNSSSSPSNNHADDLGVGIFQDDQQKEEDFLLQ